MNCPSCDQVVPVGTQLCANCGARVGEDEDLPPSREVGTIVDAEPAPYLVITAGLGRGQAFDLRGEVRLGRGRPNAIGLTDSKVSRNHARLDPIRNTYILTDLGSANGTFVNGVRITQPVRLRDGDLIHVGDTQLVFHARHSARSPQVDDLASYPAPPPVSTAAPSPAPGNFPLPVADGRKLPTWVWVGCAVLVLVVSLLVIVALTTGILIGQGLGIG